MKKVKRSFFALVAACLLLVSAAQFASASEVPYQTYTYDKWGNATPAPNGYIPVRSIGGAQLGCGNFSSAADMFYSESLGLVFVCDSGNSRIIILDENLEQVVAVLNDFVWESGEIYTLNNPQGIYVLENGTIYICDMGNKDVLVCTLDGQILSIIPEPESSLLPDNFNYQPHKIVVDDAGRIYIISKGTYQGLIYLDSDGSFIKFFGSNEVEMTLRRQVLKIWKSILSDAAASTLQSFNPIEYGNIFLSGDGFIYATAAGSENGSALMTKLNPLGIDVLPYTSTGSSLYADVTVDENGITTLLDTNNGLLMQVDENGKTMFIFGGVGSQVGLFQNAVSLIEVKGNLYVMDSNKNTITEFELTQFGELVRDAISLYNQGLYQESIEPWKEVITHNANYLLAYTGLGKAYYQLGDYETAMYYYRLANDRENYSEAFREASLNSMRENFAWIVFGIAAAVILILLTKRCLSSLDETPFQKLLKKLYVSGGNGGEE